MNRSGIPEIESLWDDEKFTLEEKIAHSNIKHAVLNLLAQAIPINRAYMFYQIVMIAGGLLFIFFAILRAVNGNSLPLLIISGTLVFCFTILIAIHELVHGLALRLLGSKSIRFGADFKKFIFYAEAHHFVMNRSHFAFVALAPLIVVKLVTAVGFLISLHSPYLYLWGMIMCTHSLFCAGDIGILSVFFRERNSEMYTYDDHKQRISYFFRRKQKSEITSGENTLES